MEEFIGMLEGERFTLDSFNNSGALARMRSQVLVRKNADGSEDVVVPVDHATKKHFRQLGDGFREKPLSNRAAPSGRHKTCIDDLYSKLKRGTSGCQVVTVVFNETNKSGQEVGGSSSGTHAKVQPIVSSTEEYSWFAEPQTRCRFPDQYFIQPDFAGRCATSLQPTRQNPGVIIEVVRTHLPEPETYERLVTLSKTAHIILLWFIPEDSNESQYNSLFIKKGHIPSFRASVYLFGGKLFENGCEVKFANSGKAAQYKEAIQILEGYKERARKMAVTSSKS